LKGKLGQFRIVGPNKGEAGGKKQKEGVDQVGHRLIVSKLEVNVN